MNTQLYSLGKSDLVKGAITAILAGVLTTLYGVVTQAGFDVFSGDWGAIFNEVIKVSISSFMAYLAKNFLSDEDGNFAGMRV